MNVKRSGKIWSYSVTKYVGTIIEIGTNKRFFFHRGRIVRGGTELIEASVTFASDENEVVKPGMLPNAYQIEILEPLAADILGGKSAAEGK